jgi:hypothetical protein
MDASSVTGFGIEPGLKPDSIPTRRSRLAGSADGNPADGVPSLLMNAI